MVTTKVASMTKWRLFESYDEAVIYHDKQVYFIYFDNEIREVEIEVIRTYGGRILETRFTELVDGDKPALKEVGSVTIGEWKNKNLNCVIKF